MAVLRRAAIAAAILAAAATAADAASSPIQVSCVGDSITAEGGNMTYSAQLGRLLGPAYNVTNQGVSGRTMLNSGLCGASPAGSWRRPCLQRNDTKPCSSNCSYWATDKFQARLSTWKAPGRGWQKICDVTLLHTTKRGRLSSVVV